MPAKHHGADKHRESPEHVHRLRTAVAIGREQRSQWPELQRALSAATAKSCAGTHPVVDLGIITAPFNVDRRRRVRRARDVLLTRGDACSVVLTFLLGELSMFTAKERAAITAEQQKHDEKLKSLRAAEKLKSLFAAREKVEQARKEAEEQGRKVAEVGARKEAAAAFEQGKKEAEAKAQEDAAAAFEQGRKEAKAKAREEAAAAFEQGRKEAEAKADEQLKALEQARKEAEQARSKLERTHAADEEKLKALESAGIV